MTTMSIPRHVVNLSAGGCLYPTEDLCTPAAQLPEIFTGLAESGLASLTIYFHGGVENERIGLALAEHYHEVIGKRCASYPVAVIWETGVLETIQSRLIEICEGSPLFRRLVGKLLEELSRRLCWLDILIDEKPAGGERDARAAAAGPAGAALATADPSALARLVLAPDQVVPELADADILQFVQELAEDEEANAQLAQIVAVAREGASRSLAAPGPEVGNLSAGVVDELLAAEAAGAAERGLVGTASRWLFAGNVLRAVMQRFRDGTDHGLLATVYEEVYRSLYADKIGLMLWQEMKENAADAYKSNSGIELPDDLHGGTVLIELLDQYLAAHGPLEVNLIGHSAGSIHICHFLAKAAKVLDADFTFKNVIFLAPACNFSTFRKGVVAHRRRVENFRIFTMTDACERQDPLTRWLPAVYPHSLLYLVSGLFEEGRPDTPLVGLARHLLDERYQSDPDVKAGRALLRKLKNPVVYSVTSAEAPPGQRAHFTSHYGQDMGPNHDAATLESIVAMIGPKS